MIDLADAGRRLGDTRVGPTPSPDEIRARLTRNRQRRRMIVGGGAVSAIAVVIAVALIAVVTNNTEQHQVSVETGKTAPATPTTISTPAPGLAGSTPYDYQRLRLWLPPGWSTGASTCHAGNQYVFFPGNNPSMGSCLAGDSGVIVVVRPLADSAPPSFTQRTVNGISVDVVPGVNGLTAWDIPSLHVEVDFHGSAAEKVAQTLQPSPLQDLLAESLPTSVPTGWQTVTFDGFQAKVPPNWPVHHIVVTTTGNTTSVSGMPPGICHPPLFQSPSVYLGGGEIPACPSIPQTTEPPIDDGLWLQPGGFSTPLTVQFQAVFGSVPERLITLGSEQALVMAGEGDSVQVEIVSGSHQIEAVIGLGIFPEVAAAILSSIAPINN
jgi:hypothetical protein